MSEIYRFFSNVFLVHRGTVPIDPEVCLHYQRVAIRVHSSVRACESASLCVCVCVHARAHCRFSVKQINNINKENLAPMYTVLRTCWPHKKLAKTSISVSPCYRLIYLGGLHLAFNVAHSIRFATSKVSCEALSILSRARLHTHIYNK